MTLQNMFYKYRLANWKRDVPTPDNITQPGDPGHSFGNYYDNPQEFYQKHGNYIINSRTDPFEGDRVVLSGKPSENDKTSNSPIINLDMSADLLPQAHKLLHHLFNSHSNVFQQPSDNTDRLVLQNNGLLNTRTHHISTSGNPKKLTEIVSHGDIQTPEHLADTLSRLFSGVLLHHINRNTGTILHPGMDHVVENSPYEEKSTSPDLWARKIINSDDPEREKYRNNDALASIHQKLLKNYLMHHLANPTADTSYASFLDADKEQHEVVKSLIKDLLAGKFKRG